MNALHLLSLKHQHLNSFLTSFVLCHFNIKLGLNSNLKIDYAKQHRLNLVCLIDSYRFKYLWSVDQSLSLCSQHLLCQSYFFCLSKLINLFSVFFEYFHRDSTLKIVFKLMGAKVMTSIVAFTLNFHPSNLSQYILNQNYPQLEVE